MKSFEKSHLEVDVRMDLILLICLVFTFPSYISAQEAPASSQSKAAVLTLTWLGQNKSKCPREVTVTNAVVAKIISENKHKIGEIKISAGTKVEVNQYDPEILGVKMGDLNMQIPTDTTDILERVDSNEKNSATYANTPPTSQPVASQNSSLPTLSVTNSPRIITTLLGMSLVPLSREYLEFLKTTTAHHNKPESGALINSVLPNSPASRAQLESGYLISKYNDTDISSPEQLKNLILSSSQGSRATLEIYSQIGGGSTISLIVDLRPESSDQPSESVNKTSWLGVSLISLNSFAAEKIKLPPNLSANQNDSSHCGSVIVSVTQDSPASRANLAPGTVITEFNDVYISNAAALITMIKSSPIGSIVRLKLWSLRGGWIEKSLTLDARPEFKVNPTETKQVIGINTTSALLSDEAFSTPQLISAAFRKNPVAAEGYLKTRQINVTGSPVKFELIGPDKFVAGLIMTTDLKPEVIFTDDVKKLFGLIDKTINTENQSSYYDDEPSNLNHTWLISGSQLILHSEWNVPSPDWKRNAYHYSPGYIPKITKQKDRPVIGVGEARNLSLRYLRNTPNAVYFEIIR